jgi:hypothetical protein
MLFLAVIPNITTDPVGKSLTLIIDLVAADITLSVFPNLSV